MLTIPLQSKDGVPMTAMYLTPGVNEVAKGDWEQALRLFPRVKKLMAANDIAVLSEKEGNDDATALSDLTTKDAKLIVAKTVNPILLEEWKSAESRPGILSAINAKIGEIEKATVRQKDNRQAVNA